MSLQVFAHRDTESAATLACRSKTLALVQPCRRVSLVNVQGERIVRTTAAHDQLIQQCGADSLTSHLRHDGDGDFRQGNTVGIDQEWGL